MRWTFSTLLISFLTCLLLWPINAGAAGKELKIYFIDVEGGQSTLIVGPTGESLLVDTGWPGNGGRDADRIVAAAKDAGLKQIDYVLLTHYHMDHTGGVPQLAEKIKIGEFVDHGASIETDGNTPEMFAAYTKVAGARRMTVKPGDMIPTKGMKVEVMTAAGKHIAAALPGAGEANSLCGAEPATEVDPSENSQSLGILVSFGKFRFIDLGDLTKKKELELMCPNNLVGTVDLFLMEHHGGDTSNPKALVHAFHPRATVMETGAKKGGDAAAWQIAHDAPGNPDIWQLHFALAAGKEHNSKDELIANVEEKCEGKYIRATAQEDGTFTLLNSRNGFKKTYEKN